MYTDARDGLATAGVWLNFCKAAAYGFARPGAAIAAAGAAAGAIGAAAAAMGAT